MNRVLIIQTAFIGDVILATPVIEAIHSHFPETRIDFLLRKGNEGLLEGHPFLTEVIIWDKKAGKYKQLLKIIKMIRHNRYDLVINLQRFLSTGLITVFSGATKTIGFNKNPLSCFFSERYPHIIDITKGEVHEVDRNLSLLNSVVAIKRRVNPKLYPMPANFNTVPSGTEYVTISPTSVWFTKQFKLENWVKVINIIPHETKVFLLGGKSDFEACEDIMNRATHPDIEVVAGNLTFLESAALMKGAKMNYVNDSAPMHMASAMDAPVTAIFCSTIPAFGFGPLSSVSRVVEYETNLDCRPCGLHGYKVCPKGHFKCSDILPEKVLGN